jgi:hypothetical protein
MAACKTSGNLAQPEAVFQQQQYTIRHQHLDFDTHSNREGWEQQGGREGQNKTKVRKRGKQIARKSLRCFLKEKK